MNLVESLCKSLIGLRELKEKSPGNEYLISAIENDLRSCLNTAEELTSLFSLPRGGENIEDEQNV